MPIFSEFYCNTLQKSFLNDKEIIITVKNPKPIEKGFFASSYVLYEIETLIINNKIKWMVSRRYSDFINLRTILQKQFPYNLISPFTWKEIGPKKIRL